MNENACNKHLSFAENKDAISLRPIYIHEIDNVYIKTSIMYSSTGV